MLMILHLWQLLYFQFFVKRFFSQTVYYFVYFLFLIFAYFNALLKHDSRAFHKSLIQVGWFIFCATLCLKNVTQFYWLFQCSIIFQIFFLLYQARKCFKMLNYFFFLLMTKTVCLKFIKRNLPCLSVKCLDLQKKKNFFKYKISMKQNYLNYVFYI